MSLVAGKVLISGTDGFLSKISSALELILEKDKESWELIQKNLIRIIERKHTGVFSGSGVLFKKMNDNENLPYLASLLVHESWHCEYFQMGEEYGDGEQEEKKCMEKQNEFLDKAGYPENKLDIEEQLKTRYWEVPLEKRNW